ncbi:baseplate J/gp47 family protein [Sphingosinicella sp. BN140058]|uniref:baseplate J/gp47 family protein n=1 Tax=Sphingosinicella sp. BN140058 TaxID=1892855 RepID=UPI0010121374|nr:baseplate J/gp47 family protein [Sphingosinicella sp. BN140058]QAY79325.1 hypothetical protein ETR14_24370 [Sphingosinicella sp. BN140058]
MIPFVSRLDDIDYDRLVEIARSRLPALAPQWTDYNIHDPGIMLVELLAWIADSQVYSLARDRKDERLAMAALLGVVPRGAVPASGVVYPVEPPEVSLPLPAGRRTVPVRARAPRVETVTAVDLLPIEIVQITLGEGSGSSEVTRINARAGAGFQPFGPRAAPGTSLTIALALKSGAQPPAGECLLSLGFETDVKGAAATGLGGIDAELTGFGPLVRVFDSSHDMQTSGAMVFKVADAARLDGGVIVLRPRQPASLVPRLLRIDVNAIPVVQRATFDDALVLRGNDRPAQSVMIEPAGLFGSDEMPSAGDAAAPPIWSLVDSDPAALRVRTIGGAAWHPAPLDLCGPADACYAMDERADGSGIALRFGNGVNGRKPALDETLAVSLRLSCGRRGNVASLLDWRVDGLIPVVRNREGFAGGADREDVAAALSRARARLRDSRLLATSAQLRGAVAGLPAQFGVGRIEVEEGWEKGRRTPASPATRTLVVARADHGTETAAWLRAVDRAVRPRIAFGERLAVIAPDWRRFRIRIDAVFAPRTLAADVREAVEADLAQRFDPGSTTAWPMGRDVDATAVAGWVRRVPGIAEVRSLALVSNAGAALDTVPVGRGALPLLEGVEWEALT